MQKKLLAFGAAIALLLLGSLALIYRMTSQPAEPSTGRPGPARGPAVPAVPAPGAAPATPGALPIAEAPRTAPPPILLPEDVPAPVPTPPPAWLEGGSASLAPTADGTPLGPLKPFVASGLGTLQRRVAECAAEGPPGAAAEPQGRRTTLTLHIESLDNQLRIVDAVPADAATSADWRVQCAQRKLRGQLMPAPSRKGQHYEVPFVLNL